MRFIAGSLRSVRLPLAALGLLVALPSLALSGCGDEDGDPCDPAAARTVTVEYGQLSADVDLGTLEGTPDGDPCHVPMDEVVAAAALDIDLTAVVVDLRGDDGFQPSQVECEPLPGPTLEQGALDLRTGTALWDLALGLRGCYSVTGVAALLVQDATAAR
jgi:hypothetical protein